MQVAIIAATDLSGLIGLNNSIPWHKPADLKKFREKTMGKHVIMGRKTFESIPPHSSGMILPGRKINIISKSLSEDKARHKTHSSIKETMQYLQEQNLPEDETVWIIGGGSIYKQALNFDLVDIVDLTIVNTVIQIKEGDVPVFLPVIPLYFTQISEHINDEDSSLISRTYKRWPRGTV